MKVTYDIIKPNVLSDNTPSYNNRRCHRSLFSMHSGDVIQVSRDINEIISKYIGDLKVRESDLKVIKEQDVEKPSEKYEVSLLDYLDVIENRLRYNGLEKIGISNAFANMLGLSYLIIALTFDEVYDVQNWRKLQIILANPEETFDKKDKEDLVYKMDRKKTLEEMKKLYEELDRKMPENSAVFDIMDMDFKRYVGYLRLVQLKAKDSSQIDNTELSLVERLKQIEGPCLSKDALDFHDQFWRTFDNAPSIVENYGDILLNPLWRERFFRYDP